MGYIKKTIKGVSWVGAFRLVSRVMAMAKIAILARLLSPANFGIFGIASLVLALLEMLTESGIEVVLIQEEEDTKDYFNTAWLVSIVRGILIAALILFTAPAVVLFFRSPEAKTLLLAISLIPLVRGFINPAKVILQKELNFEKEFWFNFSSFFIDFLVSVLWILFSGDVIGLVWGLLAGAILEVAFSFIFIRPIPALAFKPEYFRKIVYRGRWITLAGIFNYLFHHGDDIVVGKILNTTALGLYQMAYKISILPITEVANVVSQVVFPVYVKISNDIPRLKKAFLKTTLGVSLLVLPFGLLFIFFPGEIVRIFLGPKWLGIVPVLRILSLFGVIRAISGSASALFLALKKQEVVTIITFWSFIGLMATIFPLTWKFGILGASISALLAAIAVLPLFYIYLIRIFRENEKS